MYDVLQFPDEYKVGKELRKEWFLQHANLTPAEKKHVIAYAKRILILYDIRFQDGSEVPVLYTEMEFHEYAPYFLSNFIKAIASSIPYKTMIVLKCRKKVMYLVYDAHTNQKDNRRLSIEGIYASPLYPLLSVDMDHTHKSFVKELQAGIEEAENADSLYRMWMYAIGGKYYALEQLDDLMFYYGISS